MVVSDAPLRAAWERYSRDGHWSGLRLDQLAEQALAAAPALRVSARAEAADLAELAGQSERLAERLRTAGIAERTRVFLLVSDALGDIALLLALSRLDAIVFFSPPGQALSETARVLERSAARVVISERLGADTARQLAGRVAGVATVVTDRHAAEATVEDEEKALGRAHEVLDDRARLAEPTRFVTFTSGTTGEPKGIQHNTNTLAYAGRWAVELAQPAPGPVLAIISIAHAAGLAFSLLSALTQRRDLVIHLGRWNAARVVDLIEASGAVYTLCTPTHILDVLRELETRAMRLEGLTASVGGAPVTPEIVERADRAGIAICRIFGLSECPGHTSTCATDPLELRARTEGRSYPGTDDVSLDAEGRELPAGSIGEAGCRGPSLFFGYLGERSLADRLTADGFFTTGDVVRIDDGGLTVLGRLKDIVIRGGENIDPVEVESLLATAPGVQQVAVVGVPDDRLGERLAAAVQMQDRRPGSEETLLEHLAGAGVPKFKWPERWWIVDELPVNETGKVDKKRIRHEIAKEKREAVHPHTP